MDSVMKVGYNEFIFLLNKQKDRHNLNGPSVICGDGYMEYWINGTQYHNYLKYIQAVIEYKKRNNIE